jgi:putative FmdB family regulatory protein
MPIYDFHCRACGHEFEALVRPQDHEATTCPSCQSVDLERLLSSFAVSTAEKTQAAAKLSRQRQINANKDKLVADEEYRKKHEGH